jgi:hypothetical protein
VLAHVEADEPIGAPVESPREPLRGLGLAGARRAGEEQHRVRPPGIAEARLHARDEIRHRHGRSRLADDVPRVRGLDLGGVDRGAHVEQVRRHAGPLGEHRERRRAADLGRRVVGGRRGRLRCGVGEACGGVRDLARERQSGVQEAPGLDELLRHERRVHDVA